MNLLKLRWELLKRKMIIDIKGKIRIIPYDLLKQLI